MKDMEIKIEKLRKNSKEFNYIFEEATSKIEELIKKRNSERSVRPKDSKDMKIRIKVTAVPLTNEEMETLKVYLEEKYIDKVYGEVFSIRKCIFSNRYIIKSYILGGDIVFDF